MKFLSKIQFRIGCMIAIISIISCNDNKQVMEVKPWGETPSAEVVSLIDVSLLSKKSTEIFWEKINRKYVNVYIGLIGSGINIKDYQKDNPDDFVAVSNSFSFKVICNEHNLSNDVTVDIDSRLIVIYSNNPLDENYCINISDNNLEENLAGY